MGQIGRTVADALTELDIAYAAIERNQKTFAEANADGYAVVFGDASDPRIWEPMAMRDRKIAVLTAPRLEVSRAIVPLLTRSLPDLKRFAAVSDPSERAAFTALGVIPIVDSGSPPGLAVAAAVLRDLSVDDEAIATWMRGQTDRDREAALVAAEAAE